MADDLPQGTESTGARPPTASVCVDDPRVPVLRSLFDRTGFVVVGEACRGIEAVRLVAEEYPDVVIIDLAYVGDLGMRIFPVLAAVAPECVVIALSPMDTLDLTPLEAGAHTVVPERDLPRLRRILPTLADSRSSGSSVRI